MNLKEAFRFQNKLQSMMDEGSAILSQEQNITQVKTTYLRKKVMAGAEDETVMEQPTTPYSDQITEIAVFLMELLREREKLSAAICRAKTSLELPAGFDGEVGLNGMRQDLAGLFRRMTNLRASETLIANGGSGYRFNNEGNQVSYRCDICIGRRSCGSEHFPDLRPVRSVRPVPSTSLPSAGSRLVNGAKWPKRSSFPAASPIADPSSAKNAVSSRLFLPAAHHGSDSILALRPPGSHPWIPPAGR